MDENRVIDFLSKIFTVNWTESDARQKHNYLLSMLIDYIIGKTKGKHFKRCFYSNNKIPYLKNDQVSIYLDTDKLIVVYAPSTDPEYIDEGEITIEQPLSAKSLINTLETL